jgi:hypothetical protein
MDRKHANDQHGHTMIFLHIPAPDLVRIHHVNLLLHSSAWRSFWVQFLLAMGELPSSWMKRLWHNIAAKMFVR